MLGFMKINQYKKLAHRFLSGTWHVEDGKIRPFHCTAAAYKKHGEPTLDLHEGLTVKPADFLAKAEKFLDEVDEANNAIDA